jgi:hypothetical protein
LTGSAIVLRNSTAARLFLCIAAPTTGRVAALFRAWLALPAHARWRMRRAQPSEPTMELSMTLKKARGHLLRAINSGRIPPPPGYQGPVDVDARKLLRKHGKRQKAKGKKAQNLIDQVNSFSRESSMFLKKFESRFMAWIETNPDLEQAAKDTLAHNLHFCANELTRLAQALNGM